MNSTYYILALVATVTIVTAAMLLSRDSMPISGTTTPRPVPGPPAAVDASLPEHRLFEESYHAKLQNPDYQAFKSQAGLPTTYQAFPEELAIKEVRAKLAKRLVPRPNVTSVAIPLLRGAQPAIDGRFSPHEWEDATALAIGTDGSDTTLFVAADDEYLFLACDAPGETTDAGYDQFRFYFHLDITPMLVNERIHVGRSAGRLGGIRQTRIRWPGAAPTDSSERWKSYEISDWQIYQHARGASVIDGHRRYEAMLQLDEIGLHRGVPFPAWADVETDPHRDPSEKSTSRRYVGQMGAQTAPVWFVIE